MCVHMMVHACMRAHITVYYGSYKLYVDVKLVVAIHNYGAYQNLSIQIVKRSRIRKYGYLHILYIRT